MSPCGSRGLGVSAKVAKSLPRGDTFMLEERQHRVIDGRTKVDLTIVEVDPVI